MKGSDLLVHGEVITSSSTTDYEKLIILDGSKAVVDFCFGGFLLVEEAMRDFSDFGEEAVIVVDFDVLGGRTIRLHIQI